MVVTGQNFFDSRELPFSLSAHLKNSSSSASDNH